MKDDPINKAASDLLRTATVEKIKRNALEAAEKVHLQPVKIIIRSRSPLGPRIVQQIVSAIHRGSL
jgi:hypothetical protein